LPASHWFLLLLVNLFFGFNLVASKYGMAELPPFTFTAFRFALVAVVLATALRVRSGQMRAIAIVGVTLGSLHFGLAYTGLALAGDASTMAIAFQLTVPFVTLLSMAFLGERVGWRRGAGLLLAFAGIGVMGFDPRVFEYRDALIYVTLGCLSAAVGTLVMKRLRGVGVFELQAWIAVLSAPVLAACALVFEPGTLTQLGSISWMTWSAVVFSALATSIVGHGGFYFLIQRHDVSLIAPLTLFSTVFAVIFGVTLLGDVLTPRIALGGGLTLAGVLVLVVRAGGETTLDTQVLPATVDAEKTH
jgi:O-acetylserine/cysteine efflux transporter